MYLMCIGNASVIGWEIYIACHGSAYVKRLVDDVNK